MHYPISLLLTLFIFSSQPFLYAETTPPKTQNDQSHLEKPEAPIPDFSPPKDDEPIFPLHIEEPNKQTDKFIVEFLNMMATLGIVILLIFIVAWFLKRLMNTRLEQVNATSGIKIAEKRMLSPKSTLYLLEVEDKKILIAESINGITSVAEFNNPDDDESQNPTPLSPSTFSKLMERKDN